MNQKLLLLGIIALVLVGVGSYVLGTKNSQPSTQTTVSEISDWKTYTNKDYGFSIKYPNDFTYEEQTDDTYLLLANFNNPSVSPSPDGFYVEVRNLEKLESAAELKRSRIVGHSSDGINKETRTTKEGFEAIKLEYSTLGNKDFTTFIVNGDRYSYTINAPTNLVDQILSTFKFTVQSHITDETASWKTYSALTYLVKYPADFTVTMTGSTSNITDETGLFNLAISTDPTNLDLNSYVDQKSWCTSISSLKGILYQIGSEKALRFEQTPCGQTGSTDIYTIHNETAYHFSIATQTSYDNDLITLNQILSTFKFTQ